jgi:hypothetical protein
MNAFLLREFTEEEVKNALDSIGDLKAPGPNGMPSVFYKNIWDIVGSKLTVEVLHVLRGNKLPDGWNDTIISLIPKTDHPKRVSDLCAIRLCNVTYKVVSKVLAGLRVILDDVISPSQSAFVPGRLISNNILVAYEITHFLLNKREGDLGYAALKLDMSKAYDRVEWDFLDKVMKRLEFDDRWIKLIVECVSTVSYQIKVNGELTDAFKPERGLRQGDPLSPYLFLICAKGFSSLLQQAKRDARVKVCHSAPSVSHR